MTHRRQADKEKRPEKAVTEKPRGFSPGSKNRPEKTASCRGARNIYQMWVDGAVSAPLERHPEGNARDSTSVGPGLLPLWRDAAWQAPRSTKDRLLLGSRCDHQTESRHLRRERQTGNADNRIPFPSQPEQQRPTIRNATDPRARKPREHISWSRRLGNSVFLPSVGETHHHHQNPAQTPKIKGFLAIRGLIPTSLITSDNMCNTEFQQQRFWWKIPLPSPRPGCCHVNQVPLLA